MAKKVMKIFLKKEKVERKGLKLSVTAYGKEGKSMMASCRMNYVNSVGKKGSQWPKAWEKKLREKRLQTDSQ